MSVVLVMFRRRTAADDGHVRKLFADHAGGFTSKVHARCDNQCRPLGFILTGGETTDYSAVDDLTAIPVPTQKALLADKGYDGAIFRESLLLHGILPVIPPKTNRKNPSPCVPSISQFLTKKYELYHQIFFQVGNARPTILQQKGFSKIQHSKANK